MAYKEIYYLLDLKLNSSVEWHIRNYISPTQDGHALYQLVIGKADYSGAERQERIFND
jgi:hypothetical protein